MSNNTDLMTIPEVLEYLKISRATLYRMIADNKLPTYKIGKRAVRLKRQDVEALVESGKQ